MTRRMDDADMVAIGIAVYLVVAVIVAGLL